MTSNEKNNWFKNYIQDINEDIFKQIMDYEPQDEEEYERSLDNVQHEIVDNAVWFRTDKDEIVELICVYGITKAIGSYINQWGSLENIPQNDLGGREYSLSLLYSIVYDEINVSYEAYLAYYKDNHDATSDASEKCYGCGDVICPECNPE